MNRFRLIVSNCVIVPLIFLFVQVQTTSAADSFCAGNCDIKTSKSSILQTCEEIKARSDLFDDWACSNAAIFETGSIPKRIHDLRMKPVASLTQDEKAILIAADKIGTLRVCDAAGGNGFLIKYKGRPAVITTAHATVNVELQQTRCTGHKNPTADYYPNTSYFDPDNPQKNKDFFFRKVGLVYPPENLKRSLSGSNINRDPNANHDYLVFFLKVDVTKDKMPQGHQRSYFKYSKKSYPEGSNLYSLGVGLDPDPYKLAVLYQTQCNYHRERNRINHDCVSVKGSSGSLLGTLEEGQIVFTGMNRFAPIDEANMRGPSSKFKDVWNIGIASSYIEAAQ